MGILWGDPAPIQCHPRAIEMSDACWPLSTARQEGIMEFTITPIPSSTCRSLEIHASRVIKVSPRPLGTWKQSAQHRAPLQSSSLEPRASSVCAQCSPKTSGQDPKSSLIPHVLMFRVFDRWTWGRRHFGDRTRALMATAHRQLHPTPTTSRRPRRQDVK